MDQLQEARLAINDIDDQMAELFCARMRAAEKVADYKQAHGLPILDATREKEVIRRNAEKIADDTLRGYYTDFLTDTMAISRRYQQRLMSGMKVAYSGTAGAFAHIAAERIFPHTEKCAYPDFKSAYEAVENGDCDVAVLPTENSYAGEVGQVTDLIFSGSLYINGSVQIPVCHDLLAVEGADFQSIQTVVSHPQALAQCEPMIKKYGWDAVPFENTALAAQHVAAQNDPTLAAIASGESAERYGLKVLAQGINEAQTNTTRFVVLARAEDRHICEQHGAHFALMFTVRNEAGALARALNIIGAHSFNMRTLRSRPMKTLLWQYYFYVEAEGNIHSHEGNCMMEELAVCCDRLKIAGSFT